MVWWHGELWDKKEHGSQLLQPFFWWPECFHGWGLFLTVHEFPPLSYPWYLFSKIVCTQFKPKYTATATYIPATLATLMLCEWPRMHIARVPVSCGFSAAIWIIKKRQPFVFDKIEDELWQRLKYKSPSFDNTIGIAPAPQRNHVAHWKSKHFSCLFGDGYSNGRTFFPNLGRLRPK